MAGPPILAIGPHIFAALPLSLQKIQERTKMRWPAINRFGVGPARQNTGRDEDEFTVEGLYFDEEWGGHDEYLALKATQRAGQPVELLGAAAGGGADVFGSVVILEVGATHSVLRPSGIGAKVEFDLKLAPFGGELSFGGLL